jgi:DNA polymerase
MDRSGRVTPDERRQALDEIAAEVAVCTRCPLHAGRTRAVPGEGHPETEVVFVGEGPGYNEDREGRPFVGQAGGLLNELLKAIGWRREEVFITNVVKCRPPGNRDPEPAEIAACAPYLKRQLAVLDPAVVVTLGRHSLGTFMPGARISSTHGTTRPADPETGATDATTYAMYHPAAALRQGTLKETMLTDMAGLPEVLIQARQRRAGNQAQALPAAAELQPAAVLMATEPELPAVEGPAEPAAISDFESSLETATVVATAPARSDEPQLELFG